MAAFRRTPAGRPVPVTLAAVFAADSGRPASTDTRPGLRKRRRTARRCRSVRLRSDLDTAPRRPPSRPDGSPGGRSSAPTADTLAVSAGAACRAADTLVWTPGGVEGPPPPQTPRRRRPVPTAAAGRRTGRSATGGRHVPPAQGAAAPSAVDRGHPSAPGRTPRRTADTAAVSGSVDTCWGCGPGRRRRRTSTVRRCGQRTRLVDTGSPQVPGAADTRDGGRVVRTLRQRHAGQPAAEPSAATPKCRTRNGTGMCGIG